MDVSTQAWDIMNENLGNQDGGVQEGGSDVAVWAGSDGVQPPECQAQAVMWGRWMMRAIG